MTDEFEALLRGRDVPVTATKYHRLAAVLVHAAWADASSWNKVILRLQRLGLRVRSAQIPLTSIADDVAALKRLLRQVEGPVLLAGHSYAGAVINAAATDNPQVKALVYIAAIVPDEGEPVGTLFHRAPPHPSAPQLFPMAMVSYGCRQERSLTSLRRMLQLRRRPSWTSLKIRSP